MSDRDEFEKWFASSRFVMAKVSTREAMYDAWQAASVQSGQGVELSGVWQFYQDGEWRVGMNTNNHRKNTEEAGIPTRDLYTRPQPAQQGGVPSRDDLVQCLLATRGQSEGVAADAILWLFSATTPQPAQLGSVPEYDLPKGYSVRFDEKTGWHWYDDVNDRTTDCVFGSNADAAIGAWKDYSLSRWFNVDGLASYIERNFDPYLAEKVHYSSGPDSRCWQLERFSISTDAYNPEPFSRCLSNFLRQFLFTSTPQPEGDGWVKCSQKDPADADGYKVWFSPDGIRSYLLAPSVLAESTRKQGYWKPTGLKHPQPPKEGA